MSAHVLLNLLNELGGKRYKMRGLPSILHVLPFRNEINKFNYTGARMLVRF